MDNAKTFKDMYVNGFRNLGGQILSIDEHGLSAQLRVNKFHIFPFAAPELRDNPMVLLWNLSMSTRSGVTYDPRFIMSQIKGNSNEKPLLFTMSCKFIPRPEFYTLVQNASHINEYTIDLKETIIVRFDVCFMEAGIFSIMDTYSVECTNVPIVKIVTTYGVVDMKKRKMITTFPPFILCKKQYLKYNFRPEKLDVANVDYSKALDIVESSTFPVTEKHMDDYKHVNVLVYFAVALKNIFAVRENVANENCYLKEFLIMFIKESRLGDNLKGVAWKNDSSEESYCKIFKNNDILSAFARATFGEMETKSKI